MSAITAIIFDVDGTLLDTYEYVMQTFEKTLAHHGATLDREEIEKHNGRPITDIYAQLLPDELLESALQKHREIQLEPEARELLKIYSAAESLLIKLQHQGMKIAALSNRMQPSLSDLLSSTGLLEYFDIVRGANQLREAKPAPGGVLQVCEELGVLPAETIMIGDTAIDMLTGKNAGLLATVGITHGFEPEKVLRDAQADHIVHTLAEFTELIERLNHGEC